MGQQNEHSVATIFRAIRLRGKRQGHPARFPPASLRPILAASLLVQPALHDRLPNRVRPRDVSLDQRRRRRRIRGRQCRSHARHAGGEARHGRCDIVRRGRVIVVQLGVVIGLGLGGLREVSGDVCARRHLAAAQRARTRSAVSDALLRLDVVVHIIFVIVVIIIIADVEGLSSSDQVSLKRSRRVVADEGSSTSNSASRWVEAPVEIHLVHNEILRSRRRTIRMARWCNRCHHGSRLRRWHDTRDTLSPGLKPHLPNPTLSIRSSGRSESSSRRSRTGRRQELTLVGISFPFCFRLLCRFFPVRLFFRSHFRSLRLPAAASGFERGRYFTSR